MGIETLYVSIGGAIGAFCRASILDLFGLCYSKKFPLPVFIINIVGCLLVGFFAECPNWPRYTEHLRTSITSGFLGGFTTWSTMATQTLKLGLDRDYLIAVVNILVNHIFGALFVYIGQEIAKACK